jgi:hypothetical protein
MVAEAVDLITSRLAAVVGSTLSVVGAGAP